ncbi:Maf-like protein [Paenibacillus baekrokdamisoli]|uniref:dTTP/UTP pyrophosphatase n=1 Tax=Paenibacillus baekrokdamisoli TaxID=1712516 RepID=A0A3G9J881_9BACL|nr:Maf family protein [Paenibacillus baekrokdamisoli]MBB3067566.1 septum formation protein [Paenibacillus baekrokdamisoli]BBH19249.1 Maf-like protein [Paenibacillus baekrokdamisoli]
MNIPNKNSLNIRQLVLASSSPRRRELVASLDLSLPVLILSTDADEQTPADWVPSQIVEQLGLRKALAAVDRMINDEHASHSLVIGADTIVVWEGEVMGKPVDQADAIAMLTKLQGNQHEVYSGIACVETSSGRQLIAHRMTRVTMKPLSQERIERYVASGEPMDKAGSYAIQGLGATIVDRIDGCYFNVVGLPLSLLSDMLASFDVEVL